MSIKEAKRAIDNANTMTALGMNVGTMFGAEQLSDKIEKLIELKFQQLKENNDQHPQTPS